MSDKQNQLTADFFRSEYSRLSLIILLSILIISPFMIFGIYNGVDLPYHFQLAETFYRAIPFGDFYPSWGADENLGYGNPAVRFYPPITPFLLALTNLVTGNWHLAATLNLFLYTLIGGLGAYLWAKEFYVPRQAVWAGLIFIVMPYRLSEIYDGFVFAEYAGGAVLPFCFLFITRICRRGTMADVLGLSVSFAVLILTHLPLTVIGSICFALYSILMLPKSAVLKSLFRLASAVVFSLAATSFYWIKIIYEMSWIRNTKLRTDFDFDYAHNFLLTSPWFGEKVMWYLNLVLITTFVSATGFYLLNRLEKDVTGRLRKVFILFLFTTAMTVFISKPVWMLIPFLPEVQFPWRWLSVVSVCGSVIAASGLMHFVNEMNQPLSENKNPLSKLTGSICIFLLFSTICLTWIGYIANYIPANQFEGWVQKTVNSKGCDYWWTKNAKEETFSVKDKVIAGQRSFKIQVWKAYEKIIDFETGETVEARIALLNYPFWKVKINDKETEPKISDDGAVLISVPKDKSTITVFFEEPLYVRAAKYISFSVWIFYGILILIFAAVFPLKNKKSEID